MTATGRIVGDRIREASLGTPESGARLVSLLRTLVEEHGVDDVVIEYDDSRCFPNAAVPVAAAIVHYLRMGVRIRSTIPTTRHECVLKPRTFLAADQRSNDSLLVTLWLFDDETAGPLLSSLIEELSFRVACRPGVLRALEWAIYEVMDNTLTHSKRKQGVLMADVHNHGRYVALALGDDGFGIVRSLRPAVPAHLTDSEVLEMATHEGVTGVVGGNRRGNGLWGLRNIVQQNEGRLTISSGGEGLFVHGSRSTTRLRCQPVSAGWPGSFVDFQLDTGQPVDLPQALGGHDPINLRMEEVADDSGVVRVAVCDIVSNIGTRGSGERLRTFVLNLLAEGASRVVLDFAKTGMSSSSFADEVGGGLAQELGIETFSERVAFANLGDDEATLFQRGIRSRLNS